MAYASSSAPISPAPVLATLGVREAILAKSSMVLDKKARLDLRAVLRLSIVDHASTFSEEDLDELGMTLLEATAVVLKAKHSQK